MSRAVCSPHHSCSYTYDIGIVMFAGHASSGHIVDSGCAYTSDLSSRHDDADPAATYDYAAFSFCGRYRPGHSGTEFRGVNAGLVVGAAIDYLVAASC